MKKKNPLGLIIVIVSALILIGAMSTGCGNNGEVKPDATTAIPPDPHVRFGTLGTGLEARKATQYHWQSGILTAATINVVVENRGGTGAVEVIFEVEDEELDREIVHLESGEEKQITTTLSLTKYRYESTNELKVNVRASPVP